MLELFNQFVHERRYLKNVSPRTVNWYHQCWRAFSAALADKTPATLNKADFITRIEQMRDAGNQPITVNSRTRAINAFLRWLSEEGHLAKPIRLPKLKEPERVLPTFREQHIKALLSFKPKGLNQHRAIALSLVILDTGLRINEALSIMPEDIDHDALLIRVRQGKGDKQRIVPMSIEARRVLYRFQKAYPLPGPVFGTRRGGKAEQHNLNRDLKAICSGVGIEGVRCSWHTLRHSMATNYIRSGGDVFRLQRVLGHSNLETTRRYVNLLTADLSEVHHKHSLLAQMSR